MEILLGKTAGFCYGVKNAVNKAYKILEKEKEAYSLGEIIHNNIVVEDLETKGLKTIEKINKTNKTVIIRSHGVKKEIYDFAEKNKIKLMDLTCPNVLKIHKLIEEYANNDYFIFVVGQNNHPETEGNISFCKKDFYLIEKIEDTEKAIKVFEKSKKINAVIISQTTYSLEKFELITKKIEEKVTNLLIKNTICLATKLRQEETKDIAQKVDIMIIIGGKHSSNSNKLYEISKKYCQNTFFIENSIELDLAKFKNVKKIGIMAGASTPDNSINELIDKLNFIYNKQYSIY